MIKCHICGCELATYKKFGYHLFSHKIKAKEYHNKYVGKTNCIQCDKDTRFVSIELGYKKYCSNKCQLAYELEHNLRDYQDVKRKSEITCMRKYGCKNGSQSDASREKIRNSWSTKSAEQRQNITNKKASSNKSNRYYDKINSWSDEITPMFKHEDYTGIGYYTEYPWKCNICNTEFMHHVYHGLSMPKCPTCYPIETSSSLIERELSNFINEHISNIELNDRKMLEGKELDIYIPDKNIAIEMDGLYWHGEQQGKDRNYHLNKTKDCSDRGIRLFHVFENEWYSKQNIVKSILLNKLGMSENIVYARKCEIRTVDIKTKNKFLNDNHIQGEDKSSIKLGLYYNDNLVSIITFGHARYNKNYDWELIRFCNKLNTSVVGGFSRLLKHFRKHNNGSIITYADKRYSDGNVYDKNGFTWLHDSKPNYWYWKRGYEGLLESRVKYQKHKLSKLLKNYDGDMSEWDNMINNGYDRIWDCGNKVYYIQ